MAGGCFYHDTSLRVLLIATAIMVWFVAVACADQSTLLPAADPQNSQEQRDARDWELIHRDHEAVEQARKTGDKAAIETAEQKLRKDRAEIRNARRNQQTDLPPKDKQENVNQRQYRGKRGLGLGGRFGTQGQ